ncbi:MAG: hypothetical protein GYA61_07395 [Spirochaetales bacterium]|nr:hypothetical protein [Spirochaetales bacterium]
MKSKNLKLVLPIIFILFILFTSCVFSGGQNLLNYGNDYLLILNSTGNNVIAYDLTFGKFIEQPISVGPSENTNYSPQQMLLSQDENYIYIINSLDNSVTKFTRNMYYIGKYVLPAGTNPYNGFIDGNYMYISGMVNGKVIKLNLVDGNYVESAQLYSVNSGIQAIASLNSNYLITVNTNFDSSSFSYSDSIIYILRKDNLEKVKEFELTSSFIGQALTNFQQIIVHEESTGIYCDIISTGSYGYSQDSGFLRIKINLSNFDIIKISSDILPLNEYFGSVSSIHNGYLYFTSNKAIYKAPINENPIGFSSGIEKNSNVNGKTDLSLIYASDDSNGDSYLVVVNAPWGTPSSFSISNLSSSFSSISFQNYIEFPGYPVSIIFRKGQ